MQTVTLIHCVIGALSKSKAMLAFYLNTEYYFVFSLLFYPLIVILIAVRFLMKQLEKKTFSLSILLVILLHEQGILSSPPFLSPALCFLQLSTALFQLHLNLVSSLTLRFSWLFCNWTNRNLVYEQIHSVGKDNHNFFLNQSLSNFHKF